MEDFFFLIITIFSVEMPPYCRNARTEVKVPLAESPELSKVFKKLCAGQMCRFEARLLMPQNLPSRFI